jgi:hypothetical protein
MILKRREDGTILVPLSPGVEKEAVTPSKPL